MLWIKSFHSQITTLTVFSFFNNPFNSKMSCPSLSPKQILGQRSAQIILEWTQKPLLSIKYSICVFIHVQFFYIQSNINFDKYNSKLFIFLDGYEDIPKVNCDQCPEQFLTKTSYDQHKSNMHSAEALLTYANLFCDKCDNEPEFRQGFFKIWTEYSKFPKL